MSDKASVLVIEDELAILQGLVDLFVFHGYKVDSCMDGAQGLERALAGNYDCILLDVMLPSLDGFSVCNELRKHSREQPIIMLTAKSSEQDIINGLSLGADDYIAKPFSVRELVLRVECILRRTLKKDLDEELDISPLLKLKPKTLSGCLEGKNISFTRREMAILLYLKEACGQAVSRSTLLSEVWGYKKSADIDTRTVDIHMAKLRRKIEPDCKQPIHIITVRGEGYRLCSKESN
ncbi:response regulator transcription factor [Agaribacterium sp. ZY112]|uniref:response regulator transcription factor n=1 Tax=Agaribacterium sp. ZY112 TaxID=3233574 RepID=UPI00352353DE